MAHNAPLLTSGKQAAVPVPVDQYDPNQRWDVSKQAPPPSSVRGGGCRDAAWAALFVADFVAVVVLAVWKGVPALRDHLSHHDYSGSGSSASGSGSGSHGGHTVEFLGLPLPAMVMRTLAIAFASSALISALAIRFLQYHAESAINFILGSACCLYIAAGLVCLFQGIIPGAVIFILFGLLLMFLIYRAQARVRFAAANLAAACAAIREFPATIGVALLCAFVQFVWVLVWALAMFGVVENTKKDAYIAEVWMAFSLLWGQQVVHYIMFCTVAGVTGSWWFTGTSARNPTAGALKRALTTSFGSIAFGAALLAIIQTLRAMARSARRQQSGRGAGALVLACLACFAQCILRCAEDLLRFWNSYAFCYVACYGKSYCDAGKEVMQLFESRGWSAILNSDLVGITLTVGSFGVGILSGILGTAVSYVGHHHVDSTLVLPGVASVFMGFFVAFVCASVISAAVNTVFVCFASAPEALANTQPGYFGALLAAWVECHPAAMAACGYTVQRFNVSTVQTPQGYVTTTTATTTTYGGVRA